MEEDSAPPSTGPPLPPPPLGVKISSPPPVKDEQKLKNPPKFFSIDEIKNFEAVWNYIKKQADFNETNKALVYITWDRDVGSDGYTNWTLLKKPLDRGDVITSICNCVNMIKKDDGLVVGLDVTGMPDNLHELRENCVQKNIYDKNKDDLAAYANPLSDIDTQKTAEGVRMNVGGIFIVHKDDKNAFPRKMNNHISKKATDYYFTMMGDISQVLRYLRDCKYLLDCASPSET